MSKKAKKVNGYSIESLKKVVSLLKKAMEKYMAMPVENIKLCISKGNTKIGKAMNVSLPPILSCGNCKECKHFCYDIRACLQYTNVIDARVRNYVILLKNRNLYFETIDKACTRRKTNKMFRWHVSGDIIDLDYFVRMVDIARKHPDFIFWTYTKMYSIVNEYCAKYGKESIPENMSVMFSEWKGMPLVNPYGFGEFRALYENESVPENTYYCPGNCDICKACKRVLCFCMIAEKRSTNFEKGKKSCLKTIRKEHTILLWSIVLSSSTMITVVSHSLAMLMGTWRSLK